MQRTADYDSVIMDTNTTQQNTPKSLEAMDQETKKDVEIVLKTIQRVQEDVKRICIDLNSLTYKVLQEKIESLWPCLTNTQVLLHLFYWL